MATTALLLAACGGNSSSGESTAATPPPTSAEATSEMTADLVGRLDAAVQEAMTAASIPGAIVGLWGPEGQLVKAYGVADKATGAPMETDFYHRVGSVTKTFTVTGVLQLADQGRLGLDDPIAKYVDGVPQGDNITLRQLARMQSGLPNYTASPAFQQAFFADPLRAFTPQELLDYSFAQPATFPPGEGMQYSNTNTILLGLVVEKVSGQSLADYIRDHIVVPLKMEHTSFPTTSAFPQPHAQGYTVQTADDEETVATDWNPSWAWAAGAIISTLDDMRTWAPALANGTLLSPQMQQQRLQTVSAQGQPAPEGYGLGIFNLAGWIGHNGSLPGYQTVVVHLPGEQRTMVLMINTDIEFHGIEPGTALATAITKVITPQHVYAMGAPTPDVTATTTPTRPR